MAPPEVGVTKMMNSNFKAAMCLFNDPDRDPCQVLQKTNEAVENALKLLICLQWGNSDKTLLNGHYTKPLLSIL